MSIRILSRAVALHIAHGHVRIACAASIEPTSHVTQSIREGNHLYVLEDVGPEAGRVWGRHLLWSFLLSCSAGSYGSLCELEHVGALGVFGAAAAFVGRQLVVWVYLAFEALEERFAGRARSGAAVVGAGPGDFGGYPLVDVLRHVASPPLAGYWA